MIALILFISSMICTTVYVLVTTYIINKIPRNIHLLHFVVFFHVALLLSTGVDNEKALDLTNSTVFHKSIDNEKVGVNNEKP